MTCYDDLLHNDNNPTTRVESKRKEKIVRNNIDGEVTRTKFRAIRCVINPPSVSQLSKILVLRHPGSLDSSNSQETYQLLQKTSAEGLIWETVVERDQLERHLLDYNRESFRTFSSLSPSVVGLLDGEVPHEWHQDNAILREFLVSFMIPECV